jgi:protein required for attachment to host cells
MQDLTIPAGALVLVGDGRKALFLRNKGAATHVELVVENVLEQEDPPTHEQGSDRPGRYRGGDSARSSFEQTDWHQLAEDGFATKIGNALNRMAHDKRFDKLVLVAPPKVLGVLRKSLSHEATDKVLAEIPRDLTSQPIPEIVRTLSS